MKEKVIAILAAHDGLRAHERDEFKAYLLDVFTQAENSASASAVAELSKRLAALEPKQ